MRHDPSLPRRKIESGAVSLRFRTQAIFQGPYAHMQWLSKVAQPKFPALTMVLRNAGSVCTLPAHVPHETRSLCHGHLLCIAMRG